MGFRCAEASCVYVINAGDADLQRIHDEHTTIRAEAVQGVTADLLERAQHMDWAFHDHVVDHMGNQIISDIHRVNAIKIRLIRNADTRMLPDHVIWVMDMHLAVIRALLARDNAATLEAIRAHIESSRQRRAPRVHLMSLASAESTKFWPATVLPILKSRSRTAKTVGMKWTRLTALCRWFSKGLTVISNTRAKSFTWV